MPVVNFVIDRLKRLVPGKEIDTIIENLPYIALDIEGIDRDSIRLEYNPNRPDFSSDYGIARALKGLFEIETGIPEFKLNTDSYKIQVDPSVGNVRPFICALVAKNGRLDELTIKQLIAMQEDLHNGIGRGRKKVSIGIHNFDPIVFPVLYSTANDQFSFTPLDRSSSMSIGEVLESDIGSPYAHILHDHSKYPVVLDAQSNLLSFPPIINGNITRVTTNTKNLFIEVTSVDKKTANDVLAIIAMTLFDAGFDIYSVLVEEIDYNKHNVARYSTPLMDLRLFDVDINYINSLLGLNLDVNKVVECLKKSRLDAKIKENGMVITCLVPAYRSDILGAVDVVEEVAIGYGVYNLEPTIPLSPFSGQKSMQSFYFDSIRRTLAGLGMLEVINSSLVSKKIQYELMGRKNNGPFVMVDKTKSTEHEILRDSLVPSLMQSLSKNIHEGYPQKIFEIGKVFTLKESINESWFVSGVIASSQSDYTQAKSHIQSLFKVGFGKEISTKPVFNSMFIDGRCAKIISDGRDIGVLGEVKPSIINGFRLRVPVSAFEIDLLSFLDGGG